MSRRQKPFKSPPDDVLDACLADLRAAIKGEKPLPDEVGKFFRSYLNRRPSKALSGLKRTQPAMRRVLRDMAILALMMQRKSAEPKKSLEKIREEISGIELPHPIFNGCRLNLETDSLKKIFARKNKFNPTDIEPFLQTPEPELLKFIARYFRQSKKSEETDGVSENDGIFK